MSTSEFVTISIGDSPLAVYSCITIHAILCQHLDAIGPSRIKFDVDWKRANNDSYKGGDLTLSYHPNDETKMEQALQTAERAYINDVVALLNRLHPLHPPKGKQHAERANQT